MIRILTIESRNPDHPGPLHHRSYRTPADRTRAIAQLRRRGWTYFVTYLEANPRAKDAGQRYAIQYSR